MTDTAPDGGSAPYPSVDLRGSWPRRPARLSQPVTAAMVDRIVSAEFPEGSQFPIEAELCELFAVSKTVIREAVKALEGMRLLTAQRGRGTIVRPIVEWDLLNPLVLAATVAHDPERSILDEAVDIRVALEGRMAGQAARRATPDQTAQLGGLLDALHTATGDVDLFLTADLAFHDAIMTASGNRLATAVVHTIEKEASRSLRYMGAPGPDDLTESNRGHDAIHDAIVRGDTAAAVEAMASTSTTPGCAGVRTGPPAPSSPGHARRPDRGRDRRVRPVVDLGPCPPIHPPSHSERAAAMTTAPATPGPIPDCPRCSVRWSSGCCGCRPRWSTTPTMCAPIRPASRSAATRPPARPWCRS
ncbi:FadR/GntR family transcriptional regulator [Streptacidiphilus sp. PAMC 29251]